MLIIIDALELNHTHLDRKGSREREEAEIRLNGKSKRNSDLYSETYKYMFILVKVSPF